MNYVKEQHFETFFFEKHHRERCVWEPGVGVYRSKIGRRQTPRQGLCRPTDRCGQHTKVPASYNKGQAPPLFQM